MASISDIIEKFIKDLMEDSNTVQIQRNELASLFDCAPSQINYVLTTRFSREKGYEVQSKKGGGGYVKIDKIKILNQNNIPRFSFRQAAGQRIMISKDDFHKEFDSVKDCAEWFIENKICKTTKVESARTGLKAARAGNGYYCGYLIENI